MYLTFPGCLQCALCALSALLGDLCSRAHRLCSIEGLCALFHALIDEVREELRLQQIPGRLRNYHLQLPPMVSCDAVLATANLQA